MDDIVKSMILVAALIMTLIVSAPFLNAADKTNEREIEKALETEKEEKNIAYTYSVWADYPSDFLVG